MLYGHIGFGFAAKGIAPKVSIGVLLCAAMAIDILSGLFIAFGLEGALPDGSSSFPWSHGLFMAGIWTLAAFAAALIAVRDWRPALVVGLLVASHWVLDFISHPMGMGKPLPPDLPLFFEGSPKVGLGLYNSIAAALTTDLGLFAAGLAFYLHATKPLDKWGTIAVLAVIAYLLVFPLLLLLPGPMFGWVGCLAVLILLPLGIWAERHRRFAREAKR